METARDSRKINALESLVVVEIPRSMQWWTHEGIRFMSSFPPGISTIQSLQKTFWITLSWNRTKRLCWLIRRMALLISESTSPIGILISASHQSQILSIPGIVTGSSTRNGTWWNASSTRWRRIGGLLPGLISWHLGSSLSSILVVFGFFLLDYADNPNLETHPSKFRKLWTP